MPAFVEVRRGVNMTEEKVVEGEVSGGWPRVLAKDKGVGKRSSKSGDKVGTGVIMEKSLGIKIE